MSSEQDLLCLARRFDRQALAEIYDSYSPGIYRYAMRLLGNAALAEDCVAETFTRFLQALKKKRGPRDHLQAYLYRAAHNWIVDHYRRYVQDDQLDEHLQDGDQNTEELAGNRLRMERIRSVLRELTPDQRQVIVLKFLEGWENDDIARTIGKPVGAVKALQHRGLRRLQSMLKKESLP